MFEAISGVRAFGIMTRSKDVFESAHGRRKYVWEGTHAPQFARSRVRELVLRCLARDPEERPTAAKLLRAIDRLGNTTTTRTSEHADTEDTMHSLMQLAR